MESHDQTGCQTPECPMPCINNCGFLGWASMMNMCSKCYKDALLKQEQEKLAASCIENIMNGSSSGNGKEPVVTESVDIQAGVIESEIVSIESSSISSLNKSCHSDKSCSMSFSIIDFLKNEKLTGENYTTWKSNMNTILVIDDLRFVLTEECPQIPARNASQATRDAYNHWTKANDKARVYILASLSDILAKKHEVMLTAREIMESLQEMFGQSSFQLFYEAIKYIYNVRMKEGQSVRNHVLDMMAHFSIAEMNGAVIDENSQVFFILETLPKSFFQFRNNMVMNKIQYTLITLLNDLQTYQSFMKNKGSIEGEANVAHSRKFHKGSTSGTKSALSPFGSKKIQKKKGEKGKALARKGKGKGKMADKGKCFHCNVDGHWKRNCPKYLVGKKEKEGN